MNCVTHLLFDANLVHISFYQLWWISPWKAVGIFLGTNKNLKEKDVEMKLLHSDSATITS